jgi:glyoxylase-like metal-dependent hydrolase (beta-lactamase superfamily II)
MFTHHHMDHTGGTRAFVAEGATVIVPDTAQANPHVDGMLIGYVVQELGIKDATFADGHGNTVKQAVLAGIVAGN